jgi:hypothetical protein
MFTLQFILATTQISRYKSPNPEELHAKIVQLRQKCITQVEPEKHLLPLYPVDYIGVDYGLDVLPESKNMYV